MERLQPQQLRNLHDVAMYWQQCLAEANDTDDKIAASHMVGVVSNEADERWRRLEVASPIYAFIFELAADLETPNGSPVQRQAQWDAIRALMPVLEKYAK